MQKYDDEFINQINQLRNNVTNNINNSFLLLMKKQGLSRNEIQQWKNSVINDINNEVDKLQTFILKNKKEAKSTNENDEKKNENKINEEEIIIESKSELNNIITAKYIQEENKDITRNFQNEAYNYMNVNEEEENEQVAYFLRDVAKISRLSYITRKTLFDIMKDNYQNSILNKKLENNNNFNKEFSYWIKSLEKEKGKKEYQNILSQVKLFEKVEINKRILNKNYLLKLFYDLTIMYFHCDISYPSVEISFKKEQDFNSEKMIDFINRGKNRKVNFIILPSLISNGNFLENGKSFVFTYIKNTFRFEESKIENLNSLIKQENKGSIILKKIINQLTIKVYCKNNETNKQIIINTNIENIGIPKNIEYKFTFYVKDKNNNIIILEGKDEHFTINKSQKIEKYEFKLNGEIIRTSSDIININ